MVSAWIADKRLTQREREQRREEHHEKLAIRRSDFQRETLLALQVQSQKLLRTTGAMLHQDRLAFRKTGKWQKQQFPDDLSDGYLHQNAEAMLLASRVRDDVTRALTEKLRTQTSVVGLSESEDVAESRMMAAADTHQALLQRIGQLIRDLDEADDVNDQNGGSETTGRKGVVVTVVLILAIAVGWAIVLHNQRDYAKESIENFGGEEKLLQRMEDPAGKTPQQAAAERNLANDIREYDARKN
jgi:hypothetical protein